MGTKTPSLRKLNSILFDGAKATPAGVHQAVEKFGREMGYTTILTKRDIEEELRALHRHVFESHNSGNLECTPNLSEAKQQMYVGKTDEIRALGIAATDHIVMNLLVEEMKEAGIRDTCFPPLTRYRKEGAKEAMEAARTVCNQENIIAMELDVGTQEPKILLFGSDSNPYIFNPAFRRVSFLYDKIAGESSSIHRGFAWWLVFMFLRGQKGANIAQFPVYVDHLQQRVSEDDGFKTKAKTLLLLFFRSLFVRLVLKVSDKEYLTQTWTRVLSSIGRVSAEGEAGAVYKFIIKKNGEEDAGRNDVLVFRSNSVFFTLTESLETT